MFKKMSLLDGYVYIKASLALIDLNKQIMCHDLVKQFIMIPNCLSQKKISKSYQFYDPIINIVKERLGEE